MKNKVVTDEMLNTLIKGLEEYKEKGVIDPWLLEDGSIIEPLDVLKELRELRLWVDAHQLIANDKAE